MNPFKHLRAITAAIFASTLAAHADIHTFADFTRPANAAALTESFDFVPNEGWSGTPPNAISGQESVYLKVTVSWAPATNIGTFQARFNNGDDGGAPRFGIGKNSTGTSGFEFITSNTNSDPDGSGPATARPTITAINTNTTTSVTLVLKVNQIKAATTPGGDWWFATPGAQDGACGFMWINPNLAATEASQPTVWAAWRSSNTSYQGVSFITDTADAALTFSNIAIYTGDDTPFASSNGIVDPATSTVSASPTSIPSDGTTTSTISVTLRDAGNTPISGKTVTLTSNGDADIQTANNTTNASGVVTFTVTSNTPGIQEFTATGDSIGITQTASVDFQAPVVVGPVSAATSTVSASPATVIANGISTSTLTVTLRDSNNLLVVGEGVTLAGSPLGTTITPAGSQTTNGSGQATFTVKSTIIGPVVFSATSSTDNITITQTANVDFTDSILAQAFNVNFLDDGQSNATGLLGVVGSPGENWNQGTGYNTGALTNLVDTTGTIVSSVGVSGLGDDGRVVGGGAQGLFTGNRGFFGKGQDATIQITGLTPNTAYDIYLYALSHFTTSWGNVADTERAAGDFVTSNTVLGNGQSQWLDNGKAGTNGNAFVPNGNYVVFQSIVSNSSGNISIVADAYDGIDGLANTNDGNTRLHVCGLQIRPASGMSVDYMNWRTANYPTIGLPDDDDDGDGLSNNFEHIFGLNPTSGASASPYPETLDPGTGSFSYTRRSRALINLDYKVWTSTDLEDWSIDNAASQLVTSTTNGVETVAVDLDPALLGEEKLFVQIRSTTITGLDPEPTLVNLWGSGNTITLLFSEPMNPSSATNPENYAVELTNGGSLQVTAATLNPGGGSVTLTLASTLGLATGYTVDLSRVTSTTGQSLGNLSRQFRTWDDNPNGIKVFILAGQSNMVGYGNVETGATGAGTIGSLRHMAATVGSNSDYNYASLLENPANPASAFRTRSDVKVWWRNGPNGNFNLGGTISKGDLGPPYKGADSGKIGPEFAFGHILGDFYPEHDVLLIKCSWGGRDLAEKFRSPTAVANRGGQIGEFFNGSIELTREVLNNLGTQFPEWNGRGYQIVGFAWHQGYNDRINTIFSDTYKYNLPDFITDMRALFNKPNLPFVIATTGMDIGAPAAPPYTNYTKVERAQLWVDTTAEPGLPVPPLQPANVLSTDTRPFWRIASESPATSGQGFHWNHNAESYFLIGKALADDMTDLLTP
jgi:alpha-galactosidase